VEAGTHKLVYRYQPNSFRAGALTSLAGIVAAVALAVVAIRKPYSPVPWRVP